MQLLLSHRPRGTSLITSADSKLQQQVQLNWHQHLHSDFLKLLFNNTANNQTTLTLDLTPTGYNLKHSSHISVPDNQHITAFGLISH